MVRVYENNIAISVKGADRKRGLITSFLKVQKRIHYHNHVLLTFAIGCAFTRVVRDFPNCRENE